MYNNNYYNILILLLPVYTSLFSCFVSFECNYCQIYFICQANKIILAQNYVT